MKKQTNCELFLEFTPKEATQNLASHIRRNSQMNLFSLLFYNKKTHRMCKYFNCLYHHHGQQWFKTFFLLNINPLVPFKTIRTKF